MRTQKLTNKKNVPPLASDKGKRGREEGGGLFVFVQELCGFELRITLYNPIRNIITCLHGKKEKNTNQEANNKEYRSHQQQSLELSLAQSQLQVVLDEGADLARAEDGYDEARKEQHALDQLRLDHPEEIQVEKGKGQVHDDGQLHLELVDLQVL